MTTTRPVCAVASDRGDELVPLGRIQRREDLIELVDHEEQDGGRRR